MDTQKPHPKKQVMQKLLLLFILITQICSPINADVRDTLRTKIFFTFSNSSINNNFRDNATKLAHIDSIYSSIKPNKISKIKIIGSASPEGEYSFNHNLSHARAEALKSYLIKRYNFSDTLFTIDQMIGIRSLEQYKDLRYAFVSFQMREENKPTSITSSKSINAQDSTLKFEQQNDSHNSLSKSYLMILIAVLSILIIIYLRKNGMVGLEFLINKIGREGHGNGILPRNGYFQGEKGNSLYVPEDIPQARSTNNEGKHRDELLSTATYKNPINDPNVVKRAQKDISKLTKRLQKNKAKGIRYKNNRPIFAPFVLCSIYTQVTQNRKENMQKGLEGLAKRWKCSTADAQYVLTNYDFVLHERIVSVFGYKVGIIEFIPKNIHENAPHTGGVSDAKK